MMTIFDLLFIVVFLAAISSLITAVVLAVRGRGSRALAILRKLGFCAIVYVGIVYAATAFSKPVVLGVGDPQCSDDWCIAVEGVKRMAKSDAAVYDVALRIFSRARRVAQRELVAKDVYLEDRDGRRYDPVLTGSEIPLNTLLQPMQSVTTSRTFELPTGAHDIGLRVDRKQALVVPICVVIGECDAFHKGVRVRID
jgi:hypothetical protein